MQASLVITLVGTDRPGLVESVARLVAQHQGNWLESRMSRLGGQFAGILRIQLPASNQAALTDALRQLEAQNLKTLIHPDEAAPPRVTRPLSRLEIVGQDRPGIVREIARALASRGVNVEELTSECSSAPMSGETMFHARALIQIPEQCDTKELRAELEKIGQDLIIETTLQEHAGER